MAPYSVAAQSRMPVSCSPVRCSNAFMAASNRHAPVVLTNSAVPPTFQQDVAPSAFCCGKNAYRWTQVPALFSENWSAIKQVEKVIIAAVSRRSGPMPDSISSGAVFSFIGSLAPNASIVAGVNLVPIPKRPKLRGQLLRRLATRGTCRHRQSLYRYPRTGR